MLSENSVKIDKLLGCRIEIIRDEAIFCGCFEETKNLAR